MAVAASPRQRLWTRAEYERLIGLGFFHGERVERSDGEIVAMAPVQGPHATALGLLMDALTPVAGAGVILRPQMPLALGQDAAGRDSDPEPDLALVAGARRDYATRHPTTALPVIEIADSSLAYDRTRKAGIYARAELADYWIVNLVERQIEVYRQPAPDLAVDGAWRYVARMIARPGETVTPLTLPAATIAVTDVLP